MSIFSVFKGIGKSLLGVGSSLVKSPVFETAIGLVGTGGPGQQLLPPGPAQFAGRRLPPGSRTQFPTPGIQGAIQRFLPGGRTGFTTVPPSLLPESPEMRKNRRFGIAPQDRFQTSVDANGVACPPRGMHLNKSSYFLRDGTFVARGTRFVTNRKRNRSNGRANDAAIRRLDGAEDQAKKVLRKTGWRTISKQSSREIRSAKKATCK